MKKVRIMFLALFLSLFVLALCETTQQVAQTVQAIKEDGINIVNNGRFLLPITNDQANKPNDWWIWEAARYGVSNGKVESYGVKNGYAFVKIQDPGSDTWHIQFNQWVKLSPKQAYYISFRVKADKPRTINVKILQTHEPWSNYFSQTIELTNEWKTYEFYYIHPDRADETVTFGFELGKSEATTIYFSDIIIKPIDKSQVPPEYLPEEPTETIEYDFEEEEPDNLVNNGDFSYKIVNDQGSMPSEWWIWQAGQYNISSAKVSEYGVKNGYGYIVVQDTGTETWHIQFNQWVKLRKGNKYTISFKAKADEPRSINVKFVQTGAPYGTYFEKTVNLTKEWQTFVFEYTHPENADPVVTLSFELGKGIPTTFYFDDISISPVK
ncbi:MAG: carbohydrate binding domain-containing protein [Fervidobacterium sp.]